MRDELFHHWKSQVSTLIEQVEDNVRKPILKLVLDTGMHSYYRPADAQCSFWVKLCGTVSKRTPWHVTYPHLPTLLPAPSQYSRQTGMGSAGRYLRSSLTGLPSTEGDG